MKNIYKLCNISIHISIKLSFACDIVTCMFVCCCIFSLCKLDHEVRLRISELQEEEQRKQVQQVVRQYTGKVNSCLG